MKLNDLIYSNKYLVALINLKHNRYVSVEEDGVLVASKEKIESDYEKFRSEEDPTKKGILNHSYELWNAHSEFIY